MAETNQERLHILIVTPYFAPAWAYGGPVRIAYECARRLVGRGHKVTVCTTDACDSTSRATEKIGFQEGIAIHRVPNISNGLAWRRLFAPPGFGRQVERLLADVDIVHIHEMRSMTSALALPVLLKHSVPYVLSPHGALPIDLGRKMYKRLFDGLYGRRMLQNAAGLHASSEMEYRQYLAMGISFPVIELVPNGIDLEMSDLAGDGSEVRRRLGIPADRPVVGYLGRLHPIKGVDFLLDSFKLVLAAQPDALLLLVGPDDGSRSALQVQINQSGLNKAVLFTGFVGSTSEKAALYRAMDIYVLPSRYEIFGITLLEALQNQTPVITTDRCGLADMIQTQQIGAVVPFGEVNRLANAILASLAQPEVARRQARQGSLYITENYSWDSVARRWEEAYHRTLKRATIQF